MSLIGLLVVLGVVALLVIALQNLSVLAQPPWLRGVLVAIVCAVGIGWLLGWGPRFGP